MLSPFEQRLAALDALLALGWDPAGLLRVLLSASEATVDDRIAAYLGCTPEVAQEIRRAPLDALTPHCQQQLRVEAEAIRQHMAST